ncbi:hypothetical protein CAP39_03650 [Sphingomonas sp. IBVSS1]|nr:hypothetical protein CAP39_03650 [Sphingomonas sp. IBVSS1]
MIVKQREDRADSIARLEALFAHPAAKRHDIERIRQQIDAIIKGDLSESKAAYALDVHFGANPNWVVIHDLRIELDGLSAQIDHLLMNRLLDIYVLESKRLANGIKVLPNGECLTFRGKVPIAIQSPIEQNRMHIKMLDRVLASGVIRLPKRLGLTLRPKLHSIVLVSDGRISRPPTPVPGIESLIRTELVHTHLREKGDSGNPFDLAKVIGRDTLYELGQQLVALHKPVDYDWQRRLGVAQPPVVRNVVQLRPVEPAPVPAAPATAEAVAHDTAANTRKPRPATPCESCSAPVSPGVKRYCQTNKDRFDGKILCMACQGGSSAAAKA